MQDYGNFARFPIFLCETADFCLGGCTLNASCAVFNVQSSPTCAVCSSGYYIKDLSTCAQCDVSTKVIIFSEGVREKESEKMFLLR